MVRIIGMVGILFHLVHGGHDDGVNDDTVMVVARNMVTVAMTNIHLTKI